MNKTLYWIDCEWDMGFNRDSEGVYDTEEERLDALKSVDWSFVGYNSWIEVEEAGLLELYEEEI